jgi:hypothetical protein
MAVALLSEGEDDFPPGSPEETVQLYLRAVADRDATTALSFISTELRESCTDIPRDSILQRGDYAFRASLEETTLREGEAQVTVQVTETYGSPPFGGGESSYDQTFLLVQEGGEWRFSEMPWPLYCVPKPISVVPRGTGG